MCYVVFFRIPANSTSYDVREEPKVIVFIKQLLLLFKTCHLCSAKEPSINVTLRGTLVTITSSCTDCKQQFVWKSQPFMFNKYPAGNLLLSFSVLCAGSSIRKTLLVFQTYGRLCIQRICILSSPTPFVNSFHRQILAFISR